ncbi:MAG: hypothetical protein DWQ36_14360 [Acidobacteria bacterium]|nr:MAG: hypothetical protein DWQ30_19590 [Acidobacteriota bacterium]REK06387.1 MAG: hypothetical protein DWQ36_14360 [Acidobacteriota bacterium]
MPVVVTATVGIVAGLLTVFLFKRYRLASELRLYCLLAVVVGAVYPAMHWHQVGVDRVLLHEGVAAGAVALLAAVAWWLQPVVVALAFVTHGLWDLGHFSMHGADVPGWYLEACVAYDLTVGVYAIARSPDWRVLRA